MEGCEERERERRRDRRADIIFIASISFSATLLLPKLLPNRKTTRRRETYRARSPFSLSLAMDPMNFLGAD